MSDLREAVTITTGIGMKCQGHLFVGSNGLPELRLDMQQNDENFTPSTFPAVWGLSSPTCGDLYQAWRDVEAVQMQLRVAQREAKQETPQPEDELTAYKRHRALEEEVQHG